MTETKRIADIGGYRAMIENIAGKRFTVTFLDFPNVTGTGSTKDEAIDDAFDALHAFFDIVNRG